jgi:hypothetical protein
MADKEFNFNLNLVEKVVYIAAQKNTMHTINCSKTPLRILVLQRQFWYSLQNLIEDLLQDTLEVILIYEKNTQNQI